MANTSPHLVFTFAICCYGVSCLTATVPAPIATTKAGTAQAWLVKLTGQEQDEITRKCSSGSNYGGLDATEGDKEGHAIRHELGSSMPPTSNISDAQQRIYNGQLAPFGLFLSAAVLTFPAVGLEYRPQCGASLITPRHLLTAAHCAKGTPAGGVHPIRLLAGGVCVDASASQDCPGRDMGELDIELVIKEYFLYSGRDGRSYVRGPYDLAIIQLKRPLSTYLPPERAEFACLPRSNDAVQLPMYIHAWGWGQRSKSTSERPTIHQLYRMGLTRPMPEWTGKLLSRRECTLPPDPAFCLFSSSGDKHVTLGGDSGSGVVIHRGSQLTNVLYGVTTSAFDAVYSLTPDDADKKIRLVSVAEATARYTDDLCYYLGHCAKRNNGLRARMLLGSVMLTQPRSNLPPIAPFRMVSSTEEAKNHEYCAQIVDRPSPPLSWAAGLVEQPSDTAADPERVLCTATLISTAHLVASRRCIVDYLRRKGGGGLVVRGSLRIVASEYEFCYRPSGEGPFCAGVRDGTHKVFMLRPEFIAWHRVGAGHHNSSEVDRTNTSRGMVYSVIDYRPPYTIDSDLAIIQLTVADAAKLAESQAIRPACLESKLNPAGYDDGDRRIGALAYRVSVDVGVSKGVAWPRGRVINDTVDGMPSEVLLVDRDSEHEARYASAWKRGAGLLDSRNNRLLGLLLERQGQQGQRFHYAHLWEYTGVFCTFLNIGCRPNAAGVSYLDNRIDAFDRFVYVDG